MSIDLSQYRVGVIQSIEDCGKCKGGGKVLQSLKIQIGEGDDEDDENCFITVVTSANNVRDKSRVVVAPAGSSVLDDEGELLEVKKATVGGVVSQGMLCDSYMLGWKGGGRGMAAILPDSFAIGLTPPESKPRGRGVGGGEDAAASAPAAPGLFEKKLTKEEKKKLAEERRRARKAAKEAKAAAANK